MNKKDQEILIKRTERFQQLVATRIITDSVKMHCEYSMLKHGESFDSKSNLEFKGIHEGTEWGKKWESALFHLQTIIPENWENHHIALKLDFGGEGLVYDSKGKIIQGISNGSVFDHDFSRAIVHLNQLLPGAHLEFWVEASSNGLFGMFTEQDPDEDSENRYGYYNSTLKSARLVIFDKETWKLWIDLRILYGLIKRLAEDSVQRSRIIHCINKAIDIYRDGDTPVEEVRAVLAVELKKSASPSDLNVYAVGHAHIDTAWLWPVSETIKKCARTFSSQLKLIDEYEDYVFGASQPQHYQFVKDHYPELYDRIKIAVKNGRWEVQGGMWVEADCNIISGESMIRQILHGKNFFKDEFDKDVKNLWLPDVFGYSAALPQILKRSGINYFLTQKISWNQYNKFPHHTFLWQGIDGSEVLTHFPPENTYNSQLDTEYLVPAQKSFKEKHFIDEFISLFGVGDGGGGPKEENIEFGKAQKNLEGSPKVKFSTAQYFFEKIEHYRPQLSRWSGELYLELHRGTLTTQASVKKWNRKLENKLSTVEKLCSILPLNSYPINDLDRLWKLLLLNQFHDIIPGSSINETYKVTNKEYEQIDDALDTIINNAADLLFDKDENCLTIFNPNSFSFAGEIALPGSWEDLDSIDENGNTLDSYRLGLKRYVYIELPPYSFKTISRGNQSMNLQEKWSNLILENELVRYDFSKDGQLINCYDKELERTVSISDSKMNVLTLYNDRPNDWDAWDIDIFYENDIIKELNAESVEYLPLNSYKQGLIYNYDFGNSRIKQKVILLKNSKRLDFVTEIDWNEKHRMLRVSFPVDIQTDHACYDIQYGYVKRNTHRNTEWDKAKFEVVGQKYADISQSDYGVALLNDCKYGYKVFGNTLDLNLLRSPKYPDPDADMGKHKFTYSLLPHKCDLKNSSVLKEAQILNNKPLCIEGYKTNLAFPVSVVGDGLSLEVVKKHEKLDCHIVRIVETHGNNSSGTLSSSITNLSLEETGIMEWEEGQRIDMKEVKLNLTPFEIRTYRIWGMGK